MPPKLFRLFPLLKLLGAYLEVGKSQQVKYRVVSFSEFIKKHLLSDNNTLLIANSSYAVENWELANADIAFGADYGIQNNKHIVATGYMYNQMLEYDPNDLEMSLKLRTLNSSTAVNYEDFFLHFKEDTEFLVPLGNVYYSSWTSLRGVPWVFGWTVSPDHAGFSVYWGTPWNVYPWQYTAGGGATFVASFERFDSITLTIGAAASGGGCELVF